MYDENGSGIEAQQNNNNVLIADSSQKKQRVVPPPPIYTGQPTSPTAINPTVTRPNSPSQAAPSAKPEGSYGPSSSGNNEVPQLF